MRTVNFEFEDDVPELELMGMREKNDRAGYVVVCSVWETARGQRGKRARALDLLWYPSLERISAAQIKISLSRRHFTNSSFVKTFLSPPSAAFHRVLFAHLLKSRSSS